MKTRIRVGAIIIQENSLLLVQHKKGDSVYWLLPGGGLEVGETLSEGVEREVLEETSLKIQAKDLVFLNDSINQQAGKHIVQLVFNCRVLSGTLKVNPDHRLCDARWFDFKDIKDIVLRPNIKADLLDYLTSGRQLSKIYLGNIWE